MKKINKIDKDFLINLDIPENVYLLGRIWSDGHIGKNAICLYGVREDLNFMIPYLNKMGIFTISNRQRYVNGKIFGKVSSTIQFSNKSFLKFIDDVNFREKSTVSPDKLIHMIPEKNRNYFWRGYFDGDGCLYVKKYRTMLNFWSTIDQDWTFVIDLCKKLDVEFNKIEHIRKGGKHNSSTIEIRKSAHIKKVMDYIYNNYDFDKFGLERKYKKYELLNNMVSNKKRNNTHRGIIYNKTIDKWGAFLSYIVDGKISRKFLHWHDTEETAKNYRDMYIIDNKLTENVFVPKDKKYISI